MFQTVEEMYAKAHEIVGILYSYVDEGRYKKMELAKEEETSEENEEEGKEEKETNEEGTER